MTHPFLLKAVPPAITNDSVTKRLFLFECICLHGRIYYLLLGQRHPHPGEHGPEPTLAAAAVPSTSGLALVSVLVVLHEVPHQLLQQHSAGQRQPGHGRSQLHLIQDSITVRVDLVHEP
uniref:Uncharacterized protein n=1 Tax=Pseudictyota dubia TaxID=2749911 RepID=A0A7R9WF63_9STRA